MTPAPRIFPQTRREIARVLAPGSAVDAHRRQRELVLASLLTNPPRPPAAR